MNAVHRRMIVAALCCLAAGPAFAQAAAQPDHWTRAFAAPLFMFSFFAPVVFILLALATVVRLGFFARTSKDTPAPLWPLLVLTQAFTALLVFWPAILGVTLLWHLNERRKANPGLLRPSTISKAATFAALAFVLWQSGQAIAHGALVAQVTYAPPGPGEPPFRRELDDTRYARPLTADYRVALWRFPDPVACLQAGADPATAEGLARMDWDRITSKAEAEVCLFRLLAAMPDGMADFTAFAQAQGFTLSDDMFNPANPYVERDGSLRVTGHWSVRKKGPKYPTHGPWRVLHAVPYGMDVNATYTPDGRRLLHVGVHFATL